MPTIPDTRPRQATNHKQRSKPTKWLFQCARDGQYQIFVASSPTSYKKARKLVNHVYQKRGYTINSDDSGHYSNTDAASPAFTLLAENDRGETVGTVSLNLDTEKGLPCDEIFSEEVVALRKQGKCLAEVTGFAISEKHTRSKALLVHLLDFIFILARRECPCDTVVIEVNPRHEKYYQKLMKFRVAGPVRSCHRVRGAPARLLSLDLAAQHEAIRIEAGSKSATSSVRSRSLYRHFYSLAEELAIAQFLKSSATMENTVRQALASKELKQV